MEYQALFEPDTEQGGYVVTFPDFTWGVTQGDTEQEAEKMAAEALTTVIADYIEKGQTLPDPGAHRGKKFRVVRLSALITTKAELYKAFRSSGIRKTELANRMGISKTNVDRLFDLKYKTGLDQIEAAFRAIDKRLTVTVQSLANQKIAA